MILKRVNDLEKLTELIPAIALQNSQQAWNDFVLITSNDLHRYICYFLHDSEHASDILQEVYILFLRDREIIYKICQNEKDNKSGHHKY